MQQVRRGLMRKIKIEKMQFKDIPQVMELEKQSSLECWTANGYQESLSNTNYNILVAKSEGKVVGFLSMYVVGDEGYICNIAVDSIFRNCGIGTFLAEKTIEYSKYEKLKFLSLEVRESNAVAIKFYKKLGFVNLGMRKAFYSNPTENAVIMTKYF